MGFKHWHPMPVTQNGGKLSGQSGMGGVWEWTSTVLERHDGFEPMQLYPGYTGMQTLRLLLFSYIGQTVSKRKGAVELPRLTFFVADFFDGKHNIVLGGSWATHPRIAGRKSL